MVAINQVLVIIRLIKGGEYIICCGNHRYNHGCKKRMLKSLGRIGNIEYRGNQKEAEKIEVQSFAVCKSGQQYKNINFRGNC